ncbi:polysaccharide biosynthesis tyrosine autokinase [Microbacterium sp. Sa4CUA7]|uniref:Polysaccharide biosynthesis tyrosine autokinase n=1 Tax=Microbacterium pullorum TaxID=2762236 RepID=A0ABR8S521_9MICO|nr:polysaccharide biosynthesis tyrosine autokinase [Microbacterium pullorum]MBD7958571.1 polysaccharide biosynthesis tyrosine autokinase [Microbacterium pullorum]
MAIQDYVRILRRNLVLIISLTLIGVSAGALAALTTPASYSASTQLYVAVGGDKGSSSELNQGTSFARQAVTSYVSVIASSIVLDPVIEQLGLDETAEELAARVHASAGLNSVVIDVTVDDASPERAARIANAVGESFTAVVAARLEAPTGDRPSPVRIETLQPAQVPLAPTAPNMRLSLALGGLLGLAAGVGIALLREVLDTRIRTVKDVEEITGAPTLGGIALDPEAKKRPLVVAAAARDPRAEAYRSLRTNMQFLAIGGGAAAYVITSAGPSEGKSTTAANLAIAFAETGARVALLDGDLRKPKVADYFGIEGGLGLADVLVGRVAASDVIQRWGRGTLFLLPAGTVPPNPAELLGSTAMGKLMGELKAAFDVIIIDAPPTLLVTDAAVVSRFTDGAIVVAAAGSTTRPRLASAVQSIEAVGSQVLGTVVTMVPTAGADKTAYGTYAYASH